MRFNILPSAFSMVRNGDEREGDLSICDLMMTVPILGIKIDAHWSFAHASEVNENTIKLIALSSLVFTRIFLCPIIVILQ